VSLGERAFFIRHGVLFDADNLGETAARCWPRNLYLQGRAATREDAVERFVSDVLERIAENTLEQGEMEPVYNAWVVVDPLTPDARDRYPIGAGDIAQATLQANFFVRPGRAPILRAATEPD
jgi:hypothetical protein